MPPHDTLSYLYNIRKQPIASLFPDYQKHAMEEVQSLYIKRQRRLSVCLSNAFQGDRAGVPSGHHQHGSGGQVIL